MKHQIKAVSKFTMRLKFATQLMGAFRLLTLLWIVTEGLTLVSLPEFYDLEEMNTSLYNLKIS